MNTRLLWQISALSVACLGLMLFIANGFQRLSRFSEAGISGSETTESSQSEFEKLGNVSDGRLTEISGIDASFLHADCFWVHNDSGNAAEVFLISSTGKTKAVVTLQGASNIDWEDLCLFKYDGKPHICIADVGDNTGMRENYQLYLFEEPNLEDRQNSEEWSPNIVLTAEQFERIDFEYPDGPKNCEAIAAQPDSGHLYLIEKSKDRDTKTKEFGIYQLNLKNGYQLKKPIAKKVASTSERWVTAAAIDRDNSKFVFCNYVFARLFRRLPALDWRRQLAGEDFQQIILPIQPQGEAICFSADGQSLILVSEHKNQAIWRVNLPAER